jgi:hypothetical protein
MTKVVGIGGAGIVAGGALASWILPEKPNGMSIDDAVFAGGGMVLGAGAGFGALRQINRISRLKNPGAMMVLGVESVALGAATLGFIKSFGNASAESKLRDKKEEEAFEKRHQAGLGRITASPKGAELDQVPVTEEMSSALRSESGVLMPIATSDEDYDINVYDSEVRPTGVKAAFRKEADAIRHMIDTPGTGAVMHFNDAYVHIGAEHAADKIAFGTDPRTAAGTAAFSQGTISAMEIGDRIYEQVDGDKLYLVTEVRDAK